MPYPSYGFVSGRLAVGIPRGKLFVIDPRTGAIEREVLVPGGAALRIFGSASGSLMATGGMDGVIRLWDTATWTPLVQQAPPGNDFAIIHGFSSDGSRLLFYERSIGGFAVVRLGQPGAPRG